jgi:hypothetical protein
MAPPCPLTAALPIAAGRPRSTPPTSKPAERPSQSSPPHRAATLFDALHSGSTGCINFRYRSFMTQLVPGCIIKPVLRRGQVVRSRANACSLLAVTVAMLWQAAG